jgi:hypothetical protein
MEKLARAFLDEMSLSPGRKRVKVMKRLHAEEASTTYLDQYIGFDEQMALHYPSR